MNVLNDSDEVISDYNKNGFYLHFKCKFITIIGFFRPSCCDNVRNIVIALGE